MPTNDTFDFLISDEDEVLLILTAQPSEPENPAARLHRDTKTVDLFRHPGNAFSLTNVDDEVFALLENETSILVCEVSSTDSPDEAEIVYAYEALLID